MFHRQLVIKGLETVPHLEPAGMTCPHSMQFDFGKENVPERDPSVVENGITEMKNIMEELRTESVRFYSL